MKKININTAIILILLLSFNILVAQDIEIYDTDMFGNKVLKPDIVIEKDSFTGEKKVYKTDMFGNKKYPPIKVIKPD